MGLSIAMKKCDINCDLGEDTSVHALAIDAKIMHFISRCNIACGGHAGDLNSMQVSLQNAQQAGIKVGAHPGYADKHHFGRKSLWPGISLYQLLESIEQQISTLCQVAGQCSMTLDHIKLHGALYNDAERDIVLANAIVERVQQAHPSLAILGLANGAMQRACATAKHTFLREGFMDRAYLSTGQLVSRHLPGAIHCEEEEVVTQLLQLVEGGPLRCYDDAELVIQVDSICLHGDHPNALGVAQRIFTELKRRAIAIR